MLLPMAPTTLASMSTHGVFRFVKTTLLSTISQFVKSNVLRLFKSNSLKWLHNRLNSISTLLPTCGKWKYLLSTSTLNMPKPTLSTTQSVAITTKSAVWLLTPNISIHSVLCAPNQASGVMSSHSAQSALHSSCHTTKISKILNSTTYSVGIHISTINILVSPKFRQPKPTRVE